MSTASTHNSLHWQEAGIQQPDSMEAMDTPVDLLRREHPAGTIGTFQAKVHGPATDHCSGLGRRLDCASRGLQGAASEKGTPMRTSARRRPYRRLVWVPVLALLSSLLGSAASASAAQPFNVSGTWNANYHCVSGWCAGSDFPAPGVVLSQAKGSNVVTSPGAHGTISGHVLTFHGGVPGGYQFDETLTFSADGKSWSGPLTDSNGTAGIDTATKVSGPAELTVSVHPALPRGGLGVGDTLAVPVTISATNGDVNGIAFDGGPKISGKAVVITRKPSLLTSFALKDGTSRTFTFTVKVVAKGAATFSATVSGDAQGTTVTASDSKTLTPSARVLQITIASAPRTVELTADDAGRVAAKSISVRVKLTNAGRTPLTHVQLLSLRPVPAHPAQQLDQLGFAKGALPVRVGTIKPGASLVKTFTLKVTGDGDYVIDALALYVDPAAPGKNARTTAHTGEFTATVPLLYLKASREGAGTVRAGDEWFVTGHVKNLSSFQTLCLPPLSPVWSGNAGGLGPHQIGVVPVDEPAPPLAGPLPPGKTISFLMAAHTDRDAGTRSAVVIKPRAALGETGDSCNVLRTDGLPAIGATKIKVAKDSERFEASVDNSAPTPAGAGGLEFFGGYAKGSYKALADMYESGVALAREYGSVPQLVAAFRKLDPKGAAGRAATALGELSHATALTANYWINATPGERDTFLLKVSDDFTARTHGVWDGVQASVQQSATRWFDTVVSAYYSGNSSAMFAALGESSGSAITQAAVETAKFELGVAVLKKSAALVRVSSRVASDSVVLKALREMRPGKLLNLEEMQSLWGLSKADYIAFKTVAEEEGVLIGVRGRSVQSVKNLEEGAVWKHENIKPKNVNDIDTQFLGFDRKDKGLVAFRTYTPKERTAIKTAIEGARLDPEQKAAALKRMTTRFDEHTYISQIEGYSRQGSIDVGFSYRGNGIDVDTTQGTRAFSLSEQKLKGGGIYYRPLQENPALDALANSTSRLPAWCKRQLAKVLCRITGDMDGVYVTDTTGRQLSETKRLAVYSKLAKAGWQHPETLTWVADDASFLFDKKANILNDLRKDGGDAMIEFAPDGRQRATFLDLAKSSLLSKDDYYVDIVGGYFAQSAR